MVVVCFPMNMNINGLKESIFGIVKISLILDKVQTCKKELDKVTNRTCGTF